MLENRIIIYFYSFLFSFLCFAPNHFNSNSLFVVLAIYFSYRFKRIKVPTGWAHRVFQLFLILCLAQSLSSPTISRSLFVFFKYLFLYLILVDLHYFVDQKVKGTIQIIWVTLSIPLLCLGVYQSLIVDLNMPLNWYNHLVGTPIINRAFALFNNPNILGSFTLILCILALQRSSEKKSLRNFLIFTAVFSALVCVFTLSRGAILSLLIALLTVSIFNKKQRLLAIFIMILVGMSFYISGRSSGIRSQDLGANQRVELYKGIQTYISKHWISGTGLGSFHMNYPSYRTLGGYYPLYAHNQLLEIWCEGGILAFLLVLVSLGLLFFSITLPSQILLLACLSNSMVNSSYAFFVILLMLITFIDRKSTSNNVEEVPKVIIVCFAVLLALFVSYQEFKRQIIVNKSIVSSKKLVQFVDRDYEFTIQFIRQRLKSDLSRDVLLEYINWVNSFTKTLPRESETYYLLGQLAEKSEQTRVAYGFYKQSLRLDRFSEKNAIAVIRLAISFNDYLFVQEVVDRVLYSNYQYRKINKLYDQLQYFYLISLLEQQKFKEARAFFQECIWVDEQFQKTIKKGLFKES